jgi:Flp pilus assembly protein TadD
LTVSVLVAGALAAGCASSRARTSLASRFVRPAPPGSASAPAPYDVAPAADSLETVIGKIRELSARAQPRPRQAQGSTLESSDPELSAALLALRAMPGAETNRRVAEEYARLGVFDAAHRHYRVALVFDPRDAAAHDGLARLWRNARLPALALADAHRAVYYAPHSAEARNTLGTVLQALGQEREARNAYEIALAIQPDAAYALNNLGYLSLVNGDAVTAIRYCRQAIAADATLVPARHNLALSYAASGRMDLARVALRDAGPVARADYNEGVINLSLGERAGALAAFEAACRAGGGPADACHRARTLRATLSEGAGEPQ